MRPRDSCRPIGIFQQRQDKLSSRAGASARLVLAIRRPFWYFQNLMSAGYFQSVGAGPIRRVVVSACQFLASRAYSVILLATLLCTLAVKLFHSVRINMTQEYFACILSDIVVLLTAEVVLELLYFRWRRKWMFRTATAVAALVCAWSVINAGWLIRTGAQVVPSVLLPLLRDPLTCLGMVATNVVKMPVAAFFLLGPSAAALAFFFFVMAKPRLASLNRTYLIGKTTVFLSIIVISGVARASAKKCASIEITSADLQSNCQLKVIAGLLDDDSLDRWSGVNFDNIRRTIPSCDRLQDCLLEEPTPTRYNVVLIVLEGIQYRYTSLYDKKTDLTPYLAKLAHDGVEFSNTRSSLTHTTKALFAIQTGMWPSACQDIAEAVPAEKPYLAIATILKHKLNSRTAFFMSSKGQFECAPGLAYNMGFDKFFAREDIDNRDAFVGYMGCDEFSMLTPIFEWIDSGEKPFFLTFMCSVSHDPYELPPGFATPAKDPVERYRQTIAYTDDFVRAFDSELQKRHLTDNTVFCIISDHAEAFGEHGLFTHEQVVFDEALLVPWVMRAPSLVKPATRVTQPVCSVDLAPTLLKLLGIDISNIGFDGADALAPAPPGRKVHFAGWKWQCPAGFLQDGTKFIYNPTSKTVTAYDLSSDPFELVGMDLTEHRRVQIAREIIDWRKSTLFRIDHKPTGKRMLFDKWQCTWNDRIAWAKYRRKKTHRLFADRATSPEDRHTR